jgi:hypothetical protein
MSRNFAGRPQLFLVEQNPAEHKTTSQLSDSQPEPEDRRSFTARMGSHKKEANRKQRQGKTGDGMSNVKTKGENFYRYDTKRWILLR